MWMTVAVGGSSPAGTGRPGRLKPFRSPLPRNGGSFTAAAETTPGQRADLVDDLLVVETVRRAERPRAVAVAGAGRRRAVPVRIDRELHRQQVIGPEAGVHVQQRHEAPAHQSRADDERHRHRDFGDDEHGAHALVAWPGHAAPGVLQHHLRVAPRRAERRHDAEEETAREREAKRKAHDRRVEDDVRRARQLPRAQRQQAGDAELRDAQTDAPPSSDTTRLSVRSWRTSRPRRAPSARRTAISTAAPHRARQLQHGDVHARDEQHEPDRTGEHQKPAADRPRDDVGERHDRRRVPRAILGILRGEPAGDAHHLGERHPLRSRPVWRARRRSAHERGGCAGCRCRGSSSTARTRRRHRSGNGSARAARPARRTARR